MTTTVVRAACPHDCPDTCAMLVTVEDGRAIRVHGNPDHPPTHGALCTKVSRYVERTYHPDRVLRPLKRVGPKGSRSFAAVSWDEALDDIAARLTTIAGADGANAEAIVPYSYCGTMGMVQGESMAARFFHKLGASLLDRTICSSAGGEALAATYGAKVGMHVEHYAESRLIVIWGSNSITSNLHFWTLALQAKRAGAKLVCIDPRRTDTAEKCHDHIALLPGSDGALARRDLLAGRRPRTINMSTIGDDLLRQGGEVRTDGTPFGPRIEALVVYNSNPVAVAPDSTRVARGFAREDLFTVVLEHFMTDTADLADYVLPATTQIEHLDVHTSYGHTYAMINEPAIAPLGEAKANTQIFRELAASMGFDDACFRDDDEALAAIAFRPATAGGVDFAALRAQGWVKLDIAEAPFADGGFPTASGKARVDVPGLGVPDHVANYESALSTPELARRFPLAMISPPARNFLNSSFVNVTSLRAIEGEPVLEISASDAAPRGIACGQRVRIFNDRGSIYCKAVVGARARPGVVNGLGVWWRKLAADGKNGNELTHQRLTDIGRA